jgi:phage portal protein BeeE
MGLLERINGTSVRADVLSGYPSYTGNYSSGLPWDVPYPVTTWTKSEVQEISQTLPGYFQAISQSPPAFAAQMVRALTVAQARCVFRRLPWTTNGRELFGGSGLRLLENPWPNGNTADLFSRMEWHSGLAGNAYVRTEPNRLRVLRPDWVTIVYGSHMDPEYAATALDGELLGYVFKPGGPYSKATAVALAPEEIAHYAPIPDPTGGGIGISWLTPAIRDLQGDIAATDHKVNFFKNAATPNMVVKGIEASTQEQLDEIVAAMEKKHAGTLNAYKTWYLTGGADATVVGANLQQMDFKATQGAGETRISVLSRVPAPLLGISEGLAGSSLNAGNFGQARRMFADTWVFSTLANMVASLASIITVPGGSELWFDTTDMALLREDAKDAADIVNTNASTIYELVREGFTGESAVKAVIAQDLSLLVHTGLVSVQLQAPGTWHGVQDAPPGPETKAEIAATGKQTNPKPVAPTPAQAALPGGP